MEDVLPVVQANISYLERINSPYEKQHCSIEPGLVFIQNNGEIFGNRTLNELIYKPNLSILDLVPTILREFAQDPVIVLPAVVSPTFAVSLFDVAPEQQGSNEKWFKIIQKVHNYLFSAIKYNRTVNREVVLGQLKKAHAHYSQVLDPVYTESMYSPCSLFLGVALMDVYHIFHKTVHHDVEQLNFTPTHILTSGAPVKYLQDYSAIFSMKPPTNRGKYMSRQMFDQMTLDLLNYQNINDFLDKYGMKEVVKSRNDALSTYNNETFEIMKNYVFMCLKCIQSSPLIKNRHECMEMLLKCNHYIERKHSAMCFYFFKECIDSMILSNLIDKERPFCFRHDMGEHGIFYCPIPPLME